MFIHAFVLGKIPFEPGIISLQLRMEVGIERFTILQFNELT